jgi:hypothetical protein
LADPHFEMTFARDMSSLTPAIDLPGTIDVFPVSGRCAIAPAGSASPTATTTATIGAERGAMV